MARNSKTGEKKTLKRIRELEKELQTGWPPSNPKAATARWQTLRELAHLLGMRPQDLKKQLQAGTYSTYSGSRGNA